MTFLLILTTAIVTIYIGYRHDTLKQSLTYLFLMWFFSFIIDLYALLSPTKDTFLVRQPKRESFYFIACFTLGLVFLFFRFSPSIDWQQLNGIVRIALLPLILFMFPIGLAIIMVLLKYKPNDLGFRLNGLILIIPIILISALVNRIVSPQSLTYDVLVAETGGILGALFSGIIAAGLSEEFFKVVGQTRLGAYMKNFGLGWFITVFIWAFMHAPKWYSEDLNMTEAILGSIRIIPIGLMWSYLTHRTKSILPSVIVHGTNFWGIQNF
ncbi:MAG: CPBP family intramembrane metalloprotease [Saprospiraceae bacterium]|nr:CPBP family intramembrane metalloprotease [Saprospiraceae bacterium]